MTLSLRNARAPRSTTLVALAALITIGLASCGRPTAPPVIGQNCGHVSEGANVVGSASYPEDCFWQAWARCATATLIFTHFGVDTGVTHTLTIQPRNGACALADAAQGYFASGTGRVYPVNVYACAGLERSPDGGLVARGCGAEGDLVIPPPTPHTPTPTVTTTHGQLGTHLIV
jgi:hypothetical protein